MQVLLLMLLRVTRRPVLTIVFVLATAVRDEGHNKYYVFTLCTFILLDNRAVTD